MRFDRLIKIVKGDVKMKFKKYNTFFRNFGEDGFFFKKLTKKIIKKQNKKISGIKHIK